MIGRGNVEKKVIEKASEKERTDERKREQRKWKQEREKESRAEKKRLDKFRRKGTCVQEALLHPHQPLCVSGGAEDINSANSMHLWHAQEHLNCKNIHCQVLFCQRLQLS